MFSFDYSPMEALINEKITGAKSARNRQILKLRFLEGYTYAEIATVTGLSEVQVGRIVHRYGDPLLLMLAK